jgi:hypothetical protein
VVKVKVPNLVSKTHWPIILGLTLIDCGVVEMGLYSILKLNPVLDLGICIPKLAHWVIYVDLGRESIGILCYTHAKSMLHVPFNGDILFKDILLY